MNFETGGPKQDWVTGKNPMSMESEHNPRLAALIAKDLKEDEFIARTVEDHGSTGEALDYLLEQANSDPEKYEELHRLASRLVEFLDKFEKRV